MCNLAELGECPLGSVVMGWQSEVGYRLPAKTKRRILARDHGICHVCGLPGATVVDHIRCRAEGGTDHDTNLAAIHARPCHMDKTVAEAARGRERMGTARRPREKHPGLR